MATQLSKNLAAVKKRIEQAALRAGRRSEQIKLVAVSKTHPVSILNEAIAAGINIFGENKVQEAQEKKPEIGGDKTEWHLVGHLQSNKARKAVQLFDVIESVDSLELAQRLERICMEEQLAGLSVFVQVDLSKEDTKSGIGEKELPELIAYLQTCTMLKLDGFMTVPPFFEEAELVRPYFRRLRAIRDEMLPGGGLSMGMSHDFESAVEEGATVVRVGSAIFGSRDYSDG